MSNGKILFIVEGERTERQLCNYLSQTLNLQSKIFSVRCNIHMLYSKIKDLDFNINIVDFLKTLNCDPEEQKMLENEAPFGLIYLIFDYDPQHYNLKKEEKIKSNIKRGLDDVEQMINYFTNETDPTVGKMYINYPMVESYRDCVLSDLNSFSERKMFIKDCSSYKKIVNDRGFKKKLNQLTQNELSNLFYMNICKANLITENDYSKPSYEHYISNCSQSKLLNGEAKLILNEQEFYVINSIFFIFVDYFGKKFFEKLEFKN